MWAVLTIAVILLAAYFFFASDSSDEEKFVTVLRACSAGQVAVAKSILDEAGIHYIAKGEGVQDLFGVGRMGGGYNYVTGPVEIQVRKNDESEALDLLKPVEHSPPDEGGDAA